jgi:hypothetical protein
VEAAVQRVSEEEAAAGLTTPQAAVAAAGPEGLQALQDHVDDFRRSMAAFRLASEKRDVKAAAREGWLLLVEVAECVVRGVSLPMSM